MSKDLKDFLKNYITEIAIILGCALYVLWGLFTIKKTGATLKEIFTNTAIIFVFNFVLLQLFSTSGINHGKTSSGYLASRDLLGKEVTYCNPYIDKVDPWTEEHKNMPALVFVRMQTLSPAGLKYTECFDSDGYPLKPQFETIKNKKGKIVVSHFGKEQKHAFRKARKVKITRFTLANMTNATDKAGDPNSTGRTTKQFLTVNAANQIVNTLIFAVIFGYFTLFPTYSVSGVFWKALQVIISCMNGAIKWNISYSFIVDEVRGGLIKKINAWREFRAYYKIPETDLKTQISELAKITEVKENGNDL